jgi:hypothetical protein
MRPPRAIVRRMWIAFLIRILVVNAMRSDPEDRSALKRHCAASCQEILEPAWHSVTTMCQQPVVSHTDAHINRKEVHDRRNDEVLPREEEQGRDRTDMESPHEDASDPVNAAFLIGTAHAQVLLQALACLADGCESIGLASDREFEGGRRGVRGCLIALYYCGVDQCFSPSKYFFIDDTSRSLGLV